mgnify:CR=1 FL=1|jgi:hypothetical protein
MLMSEIYASNTGYSPFLKSQRPIAFEVVAAILRLGRKYQIASLRDQAYASLKKEIPVSLDDVSRAPRREIDFHFLAELINLALECDIQTVLPVAYFVTANNLVSSCINFRRDTSLKNVSFVEAPNIWLGETRRHEGYAVRGCKGDLYPGTRPHHSG